MSKRRKRKKKNNKGLPVIVFVVIVFCLCIGLKSISLKRESEELSKKQAVLENQIKSEEQRTKELEDLEKYMQTKKYMEDVAKDKLGLVYPDEILIEPENK
ncbi:MAG: septum formation initiator family protein [Lachnospiraceae bacterium]